MKIEYFKLDTGEAVDIYGLFVKDEMVHIDTGYSTESQEATVDFDYFVEERPDLGWRIKEPTIEFFHKETGEISIPRNSMNDFFVYMGVVHINTGALTGPDGTFSLDDFITPIPEWDWRIK